MSIELVTIEVELEDEECYKKKNADEQLIN